MKKGYILFSLILCLSSGFSNSLIAQTTPQVNDTVKAYNKVVIIPFEETKYLCGIQKQFAENAQKTHQEIVQFFRYGLSSEIQNHFLKYHRTLSLIHYGDTLKDIQKIYNSIHYTYVPVPQETDSKDNKNKTILFSNGKTTEVKDGQIKSKRVIIPKFARVNILDNNLLPYLSKKYGSDLYLFVTELNIENDISDPIAFINNEYSRIIKVHYNIVDEDKKTIKEGFVSCTFPNTVNDIHLIKKEYFPIIAQKLQELMPPSTRGKLVNPPSSQPNH